MLEKNPYETKRSAEVPYFMRNNNQPKEEKQEEIDLSLFELPEEEEVKVEPRPKKVKSLLKKPLTKNVSLFGGAMILALILLIVLLILVISISNQKKSIQSEYDTYKSSAEGKIERLTTQNDALKKENGELNELIVSLTEDDTQKEEVKEENKEESKTEETTQKPTTSSNIKTGTYKVNAAVRVRVAPGTGNEVTKVEDMPKTIQYIVYANSSVVPGSQVKIIEVKEESGSTWGKLADKCWICIKEGNHLYIE